MPVILAQEVEAEGAKVQGQTSNFCKILPHNEWNGAEQ